MHKKKKIVFTVILIIILSLVIFHANFNSDLIRQLQGPIEGSDSIFTNGNNLSVISKNNHIYTWQWDNLKKWPIVAKPQAQIISPLNDDKIVYAINGSKIILTDLKAEKELANLSLPYGSEGKMIKTSANGKFGIISTAEKEKINLALFSSELKELSFIFEANESEKINDFTVSDDGNTIAGVGKKDKAWIFVKDIKNNEIVWEKTFNEYGQFSIVKFSPDSKTIYAAEKTRFILCFDAITGQVLRTYEMPKYDTPPNRAQNITCFAISPENKILAADTEPAGIVWLWDIDSGQVINKLPVGSSQIISGLAFSPDSKYLAAGFTVNPLIKILKVPQR